MKRLACLFLAALCGCASTPTQSSSPFELLNEGENEAALVEFDRLIQKKPEPALLRGRAKALVRLGRNEDARQDLEASVDEEQDPASYSSLAALAYLEKRHQDALWAADAAIEIAPGMAFAHYNRALAQLALQRPARALEDLQVVVRRRPNFASGWTAKGVTLVRLGRDAEAVDAFREAVRLNPLHLEAHVNLASTLYAAGDVQASLLALSEGLRVDEEYARFHVQRGMIYADLGAWDEASQSLESAQRYELGDEELLPLLQSLRERVKEGE